MTPEEAYAEAERRAALAEADGAEVLNFQDLPLPRLPPAVGRMRSLRALSVGLWRYEMRADGLHPMFGDGCCVDKPLADLAPLIGAARLEALDLSFCPRLTDLSPLAGLTALCHLSLGDCPGLADLRPLVGLPRLQSLSLRGGRGFAVGPLRPLLDRLRALYLFEAAPTDVPGVVCGEHWAENVLPMTRAYFRDMAAGAIGDQELKLFVLGNGCIGKTQFVRRLRGVPFDPAEPSTHGVRLNELDAGAARLNVWDFGGQDVYHGSHALFLHGQAVFALLWTPETENEEPAEDAGLVIRNRRLDYWWDYLRAADGRRSADGKWVVEAPVLLIQSRCESKRDERPPPVLPDRDEFPNLYVLSFAARTERNLGAVRDALAEALGELQRTHSNAPLGRGWVGVRSQLRAMQAAPADSRVRTLTADEFRGLCEQTGGVSDPSVLLAVLHRTGVVFYKPGLFGDRVVVDQSWALDAIYAVFHRQQATPYLMRSGRFTRAVLGDLVWDRVGHPPADQELFLTMMEQCGICFRLRRVAAGPRAAWEYLAPDLLPDGEPNLSDRIPGPPDATVTAEFPFLHDGVLRRLLSNVGGYAGDRADYWRYGCYFYEATTRSRVRVRCGRPSAGSSRGDVTVDAWGPAAGDLTATVNQLLTDGHIGSRPTAARPPRDAEAGPPLVVAAEPLAGRTVFVSYAHGVCDADVTRLCDTVRGWGYTVLRDADVVRPGDCIARFMARAGTADKVILILGERYLRSPFCMAELFEVYLRCGRQPDEFRRRVVPITLPGGRLFSPADRAEHGRYWEREHARLSDHVRRGELAVNDYAVWKTMMLWANTVPDALGLIAETLHPVGFDDARADGYAAVRRLLER